MSVQKTVPLALDSDTESLPTRPWRLTWPNVADFNFDYYRLLNDAPKGIAEAKTQQPRIAILGAGVAGLTAASELRRCGFKNIDIYEASERIGGRLHSIPAGEKMKTCYELGAMRMPFFPKPKKAGEEVDPNAEPDTRNSVLDYYRKHFDTKTIPFPNPGGAVAWTGVSLDDGYGSYDDKQPVSFRWPPGASAPDEQLRALTKKWVDFATLFHSIARPLYHHSDGAWERFWASVVAEYDGMTFRQMALTKAISRHDVRRPGWFGGLGMTVREAGLFYLIGGGDGGWGAFYEISALFPIRTLICGYGTDHRLFVGLNNPPLLPENKPEDSLGNALAVPNFLGIQSLPEALLYAPRDAGTVTGRSLYHDVIDSNSNINLYTQNPVTKLCKVCKNDSSTITVTSALGDKQYDRVIVTVPTWALQIGTRFDGFDAEDLPFPARRAIKGAHWIASCKVFYPLKERYWNNTTRDKGIPQLIASDSFIQGAYGYAAADDEPGVLLVSYTWEDDSIKGNADSEEVLAERCLEELNRLTTTRFGEAIKPYIADGARPVVIRWTRSPYTRGCSKLYRASTDVDNLCMLSHNQDRGQRSGLYFAGEGYSVEGGWAEPAMRSALDALLWIVDGTDAVLKVRLDMNKDYPKWRRHAHP